MAYTQANIDAMEAAVVTIATRGAAEININGRDVKFLSLESLQKAIANAKAELVISTYGGSIPVSFRGASG